MQLQKVAFESVSCAHLAPLLVFACLRNSNWLEVDCLRVSLTSVVTVKVCCWVYCIDPFSCVDCFNKPSLRRCLGYPQTDWKLTSKLKWTAMLSIQRSCGEIPELFTHISIMAAGTGSTAFFTVICSFASRRVPFCANKFFNTGLGFSLVILLWAVDRLGRWLLSAYFFHG